MAPAPFGKTSYTRDLCSPSSRARSSPGSRFHFSCNYVIESRRLLHRGRFCSELWYLGGITANGAPTVTPAFAFESAGQSILKSEEGTLRQRAHPHHNMEVHFPIRRP